MSRVESQREALRPFLKDVLASGNPRILENYLTVRGNLPDPLASLELAEALADEMMEHLDEKGVFLWGVVTTWANISAEQASADSPREFLPFCAGQCIGAFGAASEEWWLSALDRLGDLVNDPRERVHQGVVLGLQRMLRGDFLPVADELVAWVESGRLPALTAVAEAIAEPSLLTEEVNAAAALALHRALIDTYVLLPLSWRNHSECRPLREALSYSLSIAVAAKPVEGFQAMQRWAARHDADLDWILVQNLTQARLANVYQNQTEILLKQLKPGQ